jgi:hypothetical protein
VHILRYYIIKIVFVQGICNIQVFLLQLPEAYSINGFKSEFDHFAGGAPDIDAVDSSYAEFIPPYAFGAISQASISDRKNRVGAEPARSLSSNSR